MLHRIRIDLAFTDQGVAQGLYGHLQGVFHNAITINPGTPAEEKGFLIWQKCYHDESPDQPCIVLSHQETP